MGHTLGLCQDGRKVMVVTRLHAFDLTGIHILLILQEHGIIDGVERHIVEHLCRFHGKVLGTHLQVFFTCLQLLHRHHGLTALLHREEVHHR